MIAAGIDAGSRSIKVVLYDLASSRLVAKGVADQGIRQETLARDLLERTCGHAGLEPSAVGAIVATGYGRNLITFADTTITEITCHARGVHHLMPEVRSIVEMGGQDSKFIVLDDGGRVRDFSMNDRCAAGSGRFLEMLAERLAVTLDDLPALVSQCRKPAAISSTCVVFAESEIIGLLASGITPADIAAGVLHAIAARVATLGGRQVLEPVCFTGGVALLNGMIEALHVALERPIVCCPLPQYTGALGAALLAGERF